MYVFLIIKDSFSFLLKHIFKVYVLRGLYFVNLIKDESQKNVQFDKSLIIFPQKEPIIITFFIFIRIHNIF